MKAAPSLDDRLAFAFRQAVGRRPTDRDMTALRLAYKRQVPFYADDARAAKALVSVGASPRDESLDLTEHAALSAVCLAILNLDETLTRE